MILWSISAGGVFFKEQSNLHTWQADKLLYCNGCIKIKYTLTHCQFLHRQKSPLVPPSKIKEIPVNQKAAHRTK